MDHRVRNQTNMEIYWDQVFFTANESSVALKTTTMEAVGADLITVIFRKGSGRNCSACPGWMTEVDRNSENGETWKEISTRYGNVVPLLKQSI